MSGFSKVARQKNSKYLVWFIIILKNSFELNGKSRFIESISVKLNVRHSVCVTLRTEKKRFLKSLIPLLVN